MDENKLKNITYADIFAAKELLKEAGYKIVEPEPFLKAQQIIWWLNEDPQSIVPAKVIEATENGYESTLLNPVLTVKLEPLGFVPMVGQQIELDVEQYEMGKIFFTSFDGAIDYYAKRSVENDN